mgnify:CR=1 FL=1
MNANESSKVGNVENQRLQRVGAAAKKKMAEVEKEENKVKLPQIDVKKRGKRGGGKKTSKEESCQDDVNITIEELVPPLVSVSFLFYRMSKQVLDRNQKVKKFAKV